MANNDTNKGIGVTGITATNAKNEVIANVPDMVWTAQEREAIRAIANALHTSRKPVTTDDVVSDLKKVLQAKAKSTFYAPFETAWKNHELVVGSRLSTEEKTAFMHKKVVPSAWAHMTALGCKLDVLPPTVENPADNKATVAATAATQNAPSK